MRSDWLRSTPVELRLLKNQLRIVRLPVERYVNDDEASNPPIDFGRIGTGELLAKVLVVVPDMLRGILWRLVPIKDRRQRLLIVAAKHQLLLSVAFLLNILEEVSLDALWRGIVFTSGPLNFADMITERREE